jgi:hypothetical protein
MVEMTISGETESGGAPSGTNHPVRGVFKTVYDVARANGYDVPDVDSYESEPYDSFRTGCGITARFMTETDDVAELIRTGVAFPLTWKEAVEAVADDDERAFDEGESPEGAGTAGGAAAFTHGYVDREATIREATQHLIDSIQVDMAVEKVDAFVGKSVSPTEVVFYAIATYATGWLAESLVASTDRFVKGSQSNDEAGQDFLDTETGEYRSLKHVTVDEAGHLYYQWTHTGDLVVGEDHTQVNRRAIEGTDMPATLTRRAAGNLKAVKESDRTSARYLWW